MPSPPRFWISRWFRITLLVLFTAFVVAPTLLPGIASARKAPVIEPGREREVMALFAPYQAGGEPVEGWRLHSVQIQASSIHAVLSTEDGAAAKLVLDHVSNQPAEVTTGSFAIHFIGAQTPEAEAALRRVAGAVQRNDDGEFWKIVRELEPPPDSSDPLRGTVMDSRVIGAWLRDGLLSLFLIAAVLGALAVHVLRGRPRWELLTLLAILGVGAALRLYMVEPHLLGVWAWSRYTESARTVFFGRGLGLISYYLGGVYYQIETSFAVNLAFGLLAPLAIYVHGCYLLKDHRVALMTSGLLALLPSHIRFTRSEVAFIPSIVMSSFTFALLHIALTERNRAFRWAALLGLPLIVARMVRVRPLNVLFLALFVGVALYLRADSTSRKQRGLVVGFLLLGGIPAAVMHLGQKYAGNVKEGLSLHVLEDAFYLLFDPISNTLLNPTITPILWILAAGYGVYVSWRKNHRLTVILLGWILLFHTGHAYVISNQAAMQARYYLHMAVPFLMLAAIGGCELWRQRRWAGAGFIVYSLACPVMHMGFIRDYAYNEVIEYEFLMSQRERVPEDCTILEFFSQDGNDREEPFERLGSYLKDGEHMNRFDVISIGAELGVDHRDALHHGADPAEGRPAEELIRVDAQKKIDELAGSQCLYFYSSLACASQKTKDQPIAPICQRLLERVQIEVEAEHRFLSRRYDAQLSIGLSEGEEARLTLYRVTSSHGFGGDGQRGR